MKQGTKYPERITDSSKVTFSVMFYGNTEGKVVPPYVVYKSVHLYLSGLQQVHQEQGVTNQRVDGLIKPPLQFGFSH